MAQYAFQQDAFMEGTLHNTSTSRIDTLNATNQISVGKAVKRDSTAPGTKCVAWTNSGEYATAPCAGITIRSTNVYSEYATNTYYWRIGQDVSVLVEGHVSVLAKVAVKAGDAVYCDASTGEFTNVATNNGSAIGSFKKSAIAGETVIIHINIL